MNDTYNDSEEEEDQRHKDATGAKNVSSHNHSLAGEPEGDANIPGKEVAPPDWTPTLKQCLMFDDAQVSKLLCYLPSSDYYGVNMRQVAKYLDKNSRRRYLMTLILFKEKPDQKLFDINEANSKEESSLVGRPLDSVAKSEPNNLD